MPLAVDTAKEGAPLVLAAATEKATVVDWDDGEVIGAVASGGFKRYKFFTHPGYIYAVVLTSNQGDGSIGGGDDPDLYISRSSKVDPNEPSTYWASSDAPGLEPDGVIFRSWLSSRGEAPMYVAVASWVLKVAGPPCNFRLSVHRAGTAFDYNHGEDQHWGGNKEGE